MAEPTSTAAATIAAAATTIPVLTIPVLTILGIPLGVRPEILFAGFFGGLVGIALLNTVPSTVGGGWAALLTAVRRMCVTLASSLTAGYIAPMLSGAVSFDNLLGISFLVGASAQHVMTWSISKLNLQAVPGAAKEWLP